MTNHYQILGVAENATSDEIKSAYRKLSKKFHQDKNEGDKYFEEMFKQINNAYEILSNEQNRKYYDFELRQSKINNSKNYQNSSFKQKEEELKRKEEELKQKEAELNNYRKNNNSKSYANGDIENKKTNTIEKLKRKRWVILSINVILLIIILITDKKREFKSGKPLSESTQIIENKPSVINSKKLPQKIKKSPKKKINKSKHLEKVPPEMVNNLKVEQNPIVEENKDISIDSAASKQSINDRYYSKPETKPKWYEFRKRKIYMQRNNLP